jgi:carbamoyl-phosphate synthase large subunit
VPKRTDIRKILILGAGPIVIGQACEFDYSGSQACRALMSEGYEVVLVNSNPATIMTDPAIATRTYVEPLTPEIVAAVIEKERPDALLPTMGGQTALNLAYALHENGILERFGVELIGANFKAIHIAEDRDAFKQMVLGCGLDVLRSEAVSSVEQAIKVSESLGFPLIIRTAFTLGGSGGSVVYSREELIEATEHGLSQSPINQILMEESALGWKEYEYEVMRDGEDNVVIVCSVENLDPMGVHTGDSITVAPAQTLTDREYQLLRNASIAIIRAVGVDAGGCNIQFAVHPQTGRVVIIEMNPRVSRSSALVSKATGVPIAKISAKLAIGMTLDEIPNDITRTTPACFEPAIDYVVTKIPRFSFEKFPGAQPELSPQMKSVGEVMAIGRTFQESFQKALRGLEVGLDGFRFGSQGLSSEQILAKLVRPSADRIQLIYHALKQGISIDQIYRITGIDPWFLHNFQEIIDTEREIVGIGNLESLPAKRLKAAKVQGFSDNQIAALLGANAQAVKEARHANNQHAVFKSVDTCAGEFEAYTPYFYSTHDGEESEVPALSEEKKRVVIIGGGPNRIGQGLEFDYCCVHAALTLRDLGYEAVMVNSNPETVSTDYDTSNRLYFEPLTPEDMLTILHTERPHGIIVQLGGQTPLKLAHPLDRAGKPILGTTVNSIDAAEDRDRFRAILHKLNLAAPESGIARSEEEALAVAQRIGYPLIARPSYVLGGQAMRIVYSEASLRKYLTNIVKVEPDYPVLIERFLENALEVDVDAVSDGETTYLGAILEHIEHAGVHSGDSSCVWPAQSLPASLLAEIEDATHQLAREIGVRGLLNIQFAIQDGTLYVLEVNPRASRTVPFVCKATGVPLVRMAVRVMLGEPLADVMATTDLTPKERARHIAVKAAVFPFMKFRESDPKLGPEMRSTGEVMGVDDNFAMAFAKAQLGSGYKLATSGQLFVSVSDADKAEALGVVRRYAELGFKLFATSGTAAYLQGHGLAVTPLLKKHEGSPNAEELLRDGQIQFVINTPAGEEALDDDSYIRKAAVAHNVPMATTLSGARAMADAIAALQRESQFTVRSLQSLFEASPATL